MEQKGFVFAAEAPYPQVKVKCMNQMYAREMASNIGACNSEMSAVSLYFYNSIIAGETYKEISDCFHKIMIVEMHHLDIFGRLAYLLGADPRLWAYTRRRPIYWSPGCNQYPRQLKDLLQNALRGEEEAIRKYKRQAESIRDPYVVANLQRIIEDENIHVEIFHTLCRQYL